MGLIMSERSYRQILEQRKGQRNQIVQDLKKATEDAKQLYLKSIHCEEARVVIQTIAQLTQKKLEFHVSELVSLAMAAVFEDPYELSVEFVLRRNRTECDIFFKRNGKLIDPMDESEGGAVDVASFALRVALWCLAPRRTRNVLLLDEPLKWLKGDDLPELGAEMIKKISKKIGLQIIEISHITEQIAGADRIISVKQRKGRSEIRCEENKK